MTPETFERQVKRLVEVNEVISKLEPTIQAGAFQVLAPYITGRDTTGPARDDVPAETNEEGDTPADFESFLTTHTTADMKPAENVGLITAYLYSQYGTAPFSVEEVRRIAEAAGLTVPNRIDMTLKGAKRDQKTLYAQVTGGFKPTVFGETVLKSTYKVKKGRQKRADDASQT